MAKKLLSFKTKGMNKDLSVSAFNPEFSFENMNLRLSTNEGNTLMSWVNEKGTRSMTLHIDLNYWDPREGYTSLIIRGVPIGTAIINHLLVIFTTVVGDSTKQDRIYVLHTSDKPNILEGLLLFMGNLNFSYTNPIETLVSYESDIVLKVYWTDGRNQPRVINIAAGVDNIKKWNTLFNGTIATCFDFVPALSGSEQITIEKYTSSGGIFAPGVIQYALSYVNIYGQQSNLFYVSPLYYLSPHDRGARPDEKVTASFEIKINNVNQRFDYLRIYSIQRTSLNDTPIVKLLDTLATTSDTLKYIDSGTTGALMDPTELLFIGGKEITALTMADKDLTLFLGNIEEKNTDVSTIQDYFDKNRDNYTISFENDGEHKLLKFNHTTGIYCHTHELGWNQQDISTFKGGETYRFGFQLQKETGEWSEPIFIKDEKNDKYPNIQLLNDDIKLPYAHLTINLSNIGFDFSVYKKIRPVIVYPTIGDRTVLCQGVLNPTVFNSSDRVTNSPYAQASWYFRPYMGTEAIKEDGWEGSTPIEITPKTAGSDYTPDPNFTPTNSMYVLVASVNSYNIEDILSRGYLTYNESQQQEHYPRDAHFVDNNYTHDGVKHYFDGAILLSEGNYAFFSTSEWPEAKFAKLPEDTTQIIDGVEVHIRTLLIRTYESLSSNPQLATQSFELYSGIKKTANNLYYYTAAEGAPSTYIFKFWAGNNDYKVTFSSISNAGGYVPIQFNNSGSALEFVHYSPLPCQLASNGTSSAEKSVEVQGSQKIYAHPFSAVSANETSTELFVDQSIVTLNSPDIEFDTEVQTYSVEGLKLRIIGAIPITASSSAHHIEHSALLELKHNNLGSEAYKVAFGKGELKTNVYHKNVDINAAKRLVSEYLWNDVALKRKTKDAEKTSEVDDNIISSSSATTYMIYPWHRNGPLNNDPRTRADASSWLTAKKVSSLLFSLNTEYLDSASIKSFEHTSVQIPLTENAEVMNYRLPQQKVTSMEINYYPNIDRVLVANTAYTLEHQGTAEINNDSAYNYAVNSPISMKYKSTTHAVIALNAEDSMKDSNIPILPYGKFGSIETGRFYHPDGSGYTTFWGDTEMDFDQDFISLSNLFNGAPYSYLWLGELYKDVLDESRFGGKGKEALRSNNWLVGGDSLTFNSAEDITLVWTRGDTYYQRYDCLKTYPFTNEDTNLLVEILSFMCETHTNIDGRYDRNRGQIDNTNMRPLNFNLLNPVYSQQDNFFTSKKVLTEELLPYTHPNYITWSKTKESGADVDLWTNMTLASVMELDGDKGKISKLSRLNDTLLAFQDTGISQILYNENVQISSTAGVPIEIANSGKVQGKRYISDTIGCSNKWSVCQTPSGIYFIDSHDKGIYLFNGQLLNLSVVGGFNSWSKQNITLTDNGWNPWDFNDFVTYYDKQNKDVLFINSETALAYNENLSAFTSLYSYQDTAYLCNLDDRGFWIKADSADESFIWGHLEGDYCTFFDKLQPYWMTLVGNPEPLVDKTFTNLEFRANVDAEGITNTTFTPYLPFDNLEVWNNYQHGITSLENKRGHSAMVHHSSDMTSALKRKFRIWRCDIPRDNYPLSDNKDVDVEKGIYRYSRKPMDRIRNPWAYLKLWKEEDTNKRVEIHDVTMTYFS